MADERTPTPTRELAAEAGPGFDQILERLRLVVSRLEQGNLSLEQSLLSFEEGVRLSRRGTEILDQAERRVEILVRGEDGVDQAQPLVLGAPEREARGATASDGDGRP